LGIRQWVINRLEAGRVKKEPERETESYPYGYVSGSRNNQPTKKKTTANLRTLSESPIPRRAINVIKDGITQLNWSVVAIDETDTEKYKDICKIIEQALLKPNPSDSFRTWIEQTIEDMLVCSAGSSEILASSDTLRPFRMYPVDAFSIELYPGWDGRPKSYRYAQRQNGKFISLTDSEMMYIRMNPRTNTPFGLAPLETVWESANNFIDSHRAAGKQAKNTFLRKLINLGKDGSGKVQAFVKYWNDEVVGQGQMPVIASENPSILDLGATDDKALFLEWQRFLIEVVAIAFGISPKKLGQTKDVNRSTADSEDEDTASTIKSIAENITEHINRHIIDGIFHLSGKVEFKFLYATSLKDLKTKADIDATYLDRGVDTIDEVRDSRGKKAHPNGHGEVIYLPNTTKAIDINKTKEQLRKEAPETAANVKPEPDDPPNNDTAE
jgi:HK97 family phage portal protein